MIAMLENLESGDAVSWLENGPDLKWIVLKM